MPATAKVRVELEISIPSTWGDECTVGQVRKQAKDSAEGILRKMAAKNKIKIIGDITSYVIAFDTSERR